MCIMCYLSQNLANVLIYPFTSHIVQIFIDTYMLFMFIRFRKSVTQHKQQVYKTYLLKYFTQKIP